MTKNKRNCSECGSSDVWTTTISSGGGYAPDVLPGAQPHWWGGGKLEVYICGACGHLRWFVPADALARVRKSKKFKPA